MAIITTDQAADFMRLTPATASADATLISWAVNAAVPLIEQIIGPTTPTAYAEWYDGGKPFIVPVHLPLISVTAVTEYVGTATYTLTSQPLGTQTSAWGYTINTDLQAIERRSFGGVPCAFAAGESNVLVEYIAGWAAVPDNVVLAALMLTKHLYDTTVPKTRGRSAGMDEEAGTVGAGFAVPNFVVELLQPQWLGPGVA